jgi:hypothetical protein
VKPNDVCVERESSPPLLILATGRFGGYTWKLPKLTFSCIDYTARGRWGRGELGRCALTPDAAAPGPAHLATAFVWWISD